jgi:methylmalonyl-CoA/ethylmalonyl-CoA epimerase
LIPIKRVDHVSFATWSVEKSVAWFQAVMGLKLNSRFTNTAEGYAGALLDLPGNQLQFEVLEPLDGPNFVRSFLETRGPGFHHITIQVNEMEGETGAAAELRAAGIEPFRGVHLGANWLQTYIHPRDGGGVLWQLFEEVPAPPK